MSNPGPSTTVSTITQSPYSTGVTVQTIAVSLTPLIVATITTAEQSFGLNGVSQVTAATGIKAGDVILSISSPSLVAGVAIANYRVDLTTDDKFYITFVNPTAAGVTPVSGTYLITVLRFNQSNRGPGITALSSLPSTVQ